MRAMSGLRVLSARMRALFVQRCANASSMLMNCAAPAVADGPVSEPGHVPKDAAAARRQFGNVALLQQSGNEKHGHFSLPAVARSLVRRTHVAQASRLDCRGYLPQPWASG